MMGAIRKYDPPESDLRAAVEKARRRTEGASTLDFALDCVRQGWRMRGPQTEPAPSPPVATGDERCAHGKCTHPRDKHPAFMWEGEGATRALQSHAFVPPATAGKIMCMDCGERGIDTQAHHCPPGKRHAIGCLDPRHVADHDWIDCDERHGCNRPDDCHREFRCDLPREQHPPATAGAGRLNMDDEALVAEIAFDIGQATKMQPSMDGRCKRLHNDDENRRIARAAIRAINHYDAIARRAKDGTR